MGICTITPLPEEGKNNRKINMESDWAHASYEVYASYNHISELRHTAFLESSAPRHKPKALLKNWLKLVDLR